MSVPDTDAIPDGVSGVIRQFPSAYGTQFCGQMTRGPDAAVICPKARMQSVGIFPENYTAATSYTSETAHGWGGGWEYFMFPTASAYDPVSGTVYVTDKLNFGGGGNQLPSGQLQLWEASKANQNIATQLADYPWTTFLSPGAAYSPRVVDDFSSHAGKQALNYAGGMVVDATRRFLYISESLENRIIRFDIDGTGAPVISSRRILNFNGTLRFPQGLDVDATGNVYIVDTGNSRVVVANPDGQVLGVMGGLGRAPGELRRPYAVAVDRLQERVYIVDGDVARIQVYALDGTPLFRFNAVNDTSVRKFESLGGIIAHDGVISLSARLSGTLTGAEADIAVFQMNY
jgi:DNA-binding beta-propeller fold protein YncE